ncbi:hypothetical protein [Leptospira licerasiae]|uniref:DUF2268 domain-containing protein n=1 Tax=Leptospira licerasiae str. MMD4847 TaxID=1049971 RepID=A0ABP2RGA7_9LEPT|nr:hypothetical protein [Leptospira licerasiae]EIE02975.1 hypothetical protein LEP1GSC185_1064 [Leptospira licerasiae serovar Varillal str. VAR 010]EJZ43519.1 hypothetical protein LEP1GSC178_3480 [Leptospira licerasiae str. MMD4847]
MRSIFTIFAIYLFFIIFFFETTGAQTTKRKVEGFEFYFLSDWNKQRNPERLLETFAEKFVTEIRSESERLERRIPQDAQVFVSENSEVFRKYSGQPGSTAAFYSPESNKFFFQNPESLAKRGILETVIKHEICHFLAPEPKSETSFWMQESYCESLHPTNLKPTSADLKFPWSWEKFDEECTKEIRTKSGPKKKILYQKLSLWGSWLLKTKGEARFRVFLENPSPEIATIYSQFVKSRY